MWRTEEWKNSLLMVSKVGSVRSGVLDLPCIREKKKIKRVARRGGVGKWIDKGEIGH